MEATPRKKRILAVGALVVMALVFCFILLLGHQEKQGSACAGVRITVQDTTDRHFVSEEAVLAQLADSFGSLEGRRLDSLDLAEIEHALDGGVGILKSEVWLTPDRYLHASILQRRPVVRIQTAGGGFYSDAEGYILPLLTGSAFRVQTVDGAVPMALKKGFSGFLPDGPEQVYLRQLLGFVAEINRSERWGDAVAQIHVEQGGDLTLILRDRPERFLFGPPTDAATKLARMEQYFRKVLPQLPDGASYKSVNLQYKGQIICRNK